MKIKNFLGIILLFSIFIGCSTNKEIAKDKVIDPQISTCITAKIDVRDEILLISFTNNCDSSKYLFNYYFKHRSPNNKYFHRKQDDKSIYSFVPLINNIGTILTDEVILKDEYIFRKYQAKWTFNEIKNKSTLELELYNSDLCFFSSKPSMYKIFSFLTTENSKLELIPNVNKKSLTLQFAVFKRVQSLTILGSEYNDQRFYNQEKQDFELVEATFSCSH